MSIPGIISRASLRSVIAITAFASLTAMVIYIVAVSEKKIAISGNIDASALLTAFISIVSLVLGWLFGRHGARG